MSKGWLRRSSNRFNTVPLKFRCGLVVSAAYCETVSFNYYSKANNYAQRVYEWLELAKKRKRVQIQSRNNYSISRNLTQFRLAAEQGYVSIQIVHIVPETADRRVRIRMHGNLTSLTTMRYVDQSACNISLSFN